MDRKKILFGIMIGFALVASFLATFYLTDWRYVETTDNAYIQADISIISAKVTEYVHNIHVRENQLVKKGDLLMTLDSERFRAKLKEAQASIDLVKASLQDVEARLVLQTSIIQEAQARIESAEAEVCRTKKDYDRTLSLGRDDIVSQKRLDQSNAAYSKAAADLKSASAALKAARQQIPVLEAEHKQNQAKLMQAYAEKAIAQDDFNNTRISAPVSGMVGNKIVQVGQLVRPGQQLLSIVPCDAYVYANFKETQFGHMQKDQKARITVDAYPGEEFSGYIESLSPASGAVFSLLPPENATGNFTKIVQRIPVKIMFDKPVACHKMKPGMSAVVSINTKGSPD